MTRARASLLLLVTAASLALGTLTRALAWQPSPAAGLIVAFSGLVLAASSALAVRILVVADRATRPSESQGAHS